MKVFFFFHAVNVYVWLSRSIFFRFSDKNESPFSFPKRHFRQALNQAMVTSRANWSKARKIDPVSRVFSFYFLSPIPERWRTSDPPFRHGYSSRPRDFQPWRHSSRDLTVTSLNTWLDRDVSQLVFWRETSRPLSYRRIIIIKKMYWICSELY